MERQVPRIMDDSGGKAQLSANEATTTNAQQQQQQQHEPLHPDNVFRTKEILHGALCRVHGEREEGLYGENAKAGMCGCCILPAGATNKRGQIVIEKIWD